MTEIYLHIVARMADDMATHLAHGDGAGEGVGDEAARRRLLRLDITHTSSATNH